MEAVWGGLTVVTGVGLAVAVWCERARMRNAVLLGLLVLLAYLWLLARSGGRYGWELAVLALSLRAVLVTALVLPLALVANGVLMWRRERRRLGNLLSLLVGLALGAVVLSVPVVGVLGPAWVAWPVAGIVLATAYVGYAGLCLLVYSWFYRAVAGALHPRAIVVLGAGLRGTRPSPLLARRLDRAHQVWARERDRGGAPLLVVSGGQGPDEVVAESTAMAGYLVEHGVPRELVAEEGRSRSTEQNLRFSGALLAERGTPAPVVVVTSDYHVLRAAFLARRLGLRMDVLGARTVLYYRPSAYLRELAGVLYAHRWVHLAVVVVLFGLPIVSGLLRA